MRTLLIRRIGGLRKVANRNYLAPFFLRHVLTETPLTRLKMDQSESSVYLLQYKRSFNGFNRQQHIEHKLYT